MILKHPQKCMNIPFNHKATDLHKGHPKIGYYKLQMIIQPGQILMLLIIRQVGVGGKPEKHDVESFGSYRYYRLVTVTITGTVLSGLADRIHSHSYR